MSDPLVYYWLVVDRSLSSLQALERDGMHIHVHLDDSNILSASFSQVFLETGGPSLVVTVFAKDEVCVVLFLIELHARSFHDLPGGRRR